MSSPLALVEGRDVLWLDEYLRSSVGWNWGFSSYVRSCVPTVGCPFRDTTLQAVGTFTLSQFLKKVTCLRLSETEMCDGLKACPG